MPDADRLTLTDLPRLPAADFWSLRFVEEHCETYAVRKNVAMPFVASTDRGAMATVYVDGGYGYAATGDTSRGRPARSAGARGAVGAQHREAGAVRLEVAAPPRAAR